MTSQTLRSFIFFPPRERMLWASEQWWTWVAPERVFLGFFFSFFSVRMTSHVKIVRPAGCCHSDKVAVSLLWSDAHAWQGREKKNCLSYRTTILPESHLCCHWPRTSAHFELVFSYAVTTPVRIRVAIANRKKSQRDFESRSVWPGP